MIILWIQISDEGPVAALHVKQPGRGGVAWALTTPYVPSNTVKLVQPPNRYMLRCKMCINTEQNDECRHLRSRNTQTNTNTKRMPINKWELWSKYCTLFVLGNLSKIRQSSSNLKTTVPKQKCVHGEIKSRLIYRNACSHTFQNLFPSSI